VTVAETLVNTNAVPFRPDQRQRQLARPAPAIRRPKLLTIS
jgi:predicted nucleic acid-binding Zn ribbon protein